METTLLSPIEALVGSRVRMRRVMLGFSQERSGDGLGIACRIQEYEKGANRTDARRSMAISKILDVVSGFLFQDDGNAVLREIIAGESREGAPFVSSNEGISLNRAFARIKDRVARKKVVALANVRVGKGCDHNADPFHVPEDLNGSEQELRI